MSTARHIIITAALLAALSAILIGHTLATSVAGQPVKAPIVACWFEDGGPAGPDRPQSVPCLWDATTQGNGQGQSFILWADPYAVQV